jgi:hypothetical protein
MNKPKHNHKPINMSDSRQLPLLLQTIQFRLSLKMPKKAIKMLDSWWLPQFLAMIQFWPLTNRLLKMPKM